MKRWNKKMTAGVLASALVLGAGGTLGWQSQASAQDSAGTGQAASGQTQDNASSLKDRLHHVFGKGGEGALRKFGFSMLDSAATSLNLTRGQLDEQLKAGKTLEQVAAAQGVSVDDLKTKLVAAETKAIDDAAAKGDITADTAQKLKDAAPKMIDKAITAKNIGKPEHKDGGKFARPFQLMKATADTLGMDETQLTESLKSGKSPLDLAAQRGINEKDFTSKLSASLNANIDQAVKDGKIDATASAKMKENTSKIVDRFIHHKGLPDFKRMKHRGGDWPMMKAAADALGMKKEDVAKALKDGKSLAELAAGKGMSKEDLIAKIKDGLTPSITKFVDHKRGDGKGKADSKTNSN